MAAQSSNRRVQLWHEVDLFLEEYGTQPDEINMLSRYLQARPRSTGVQTIVDENEIEERLALGELVMNTIRGRGPDEEISELMEHRRWTALELSIIMVMPIAKLEKLHSHLNTRAEFHSMKTMLKIFLQRNISGCEINARRSSRTSASSLSVRKRKPTADSDAGYDPAEKGSVDRSSSEARKCLKRDNQACIFLGTKNPEACHIVPFVANSTVASLNNMAELTAFYGRFWADENSAFIRLLSSHQGCSDKAWNMLSMNRQMHFWWGKAYFALKCLAIIPSNDGVSTIQIQFRWMQRRILEDPDRKISLDECTTQKEAHGDESKEMVSKAERDKTVNVYEARKFIRGSGSYYGTPDIAGSASGEGVGIVSAADAASGRPLHSGRVFEIQMPAQDAENMKVMLDFQWACILISVMSGAAGWPSFVGDDEDDGDAALVNEWLQTASLASPPEVPADTPGSSHVLPAQEEAVSGILGEMPPQPSMAPQPREMSPDKQRQVEATKEKSGLPRG